MSSLSEAAAQPQYSPDDLYAAYAAGVADGADEDAPALTPAVAALLSELRERWRAAHPLRERPAWPVPVPDWLRERQDDEGQPVRPIWS